MARYDREDNNEFSLAEKCFHISVFTSISQTCQPNPLRFSKRGYYNVYFECRLISIYYPITLENASTMCTLFVSSSIRLSSVCFLPTIGKNKALLFATEKVKFFPGWCKEIAIKSAQISYIVYLKFQP